EESRSRPAVLHLMTFAARQAGRLDESLAHVDSLLALQPSADFALLRAEILGELGRYVHAEAALDEVVTAPHKRAAGLLVRAAMRLRQGREADAQDDIRTAVTEDPKATEADWQIALPQIWRSIEVGDAGNALVLLDAMPEPVAASTDASLARARTLRLLGRDDEAARVLDTLLDSDPNLVPALTERAWIRLERGDDAGGNADVQAAARAAEGNTRAAVLHLMAFAARRAGRLDEALSHVDELLAMHPVADFALLRAEILGELGRFGDAETALDAVVDSQRRAAGLLVRAAMRLRQHRADDARTDIEQAVTGDSAATLADWQVALPQVWALIQAADPTGALTLLDAMPESVANFTDAALARARALRLAGRDDEAERVLDGVLGRGDGPVEALIERAWIRLERGDEAAGIEDAEAARRSGEQRARPAVLHLLTFAARRAGRLDDALAHVDELVAAQPGPDFSLLRAEILAELGRFDDAEAALGSVVDSSRRSAGLLVRAAMRMRQGNTDTALDDLRRASDGEAPATASDWQVAMPQVWGLIESGDPTNALVLLDAMPEAIANETDPTLARARALRQLGRNEEAERLLDCVLDQQPGLTAARVERAWIRLERGNEAGGSEDAHAASNSNEGDARHRPAILHLLTFAARRSGRLDEALAHVDQLLTVQPAADFSLLRAEILGELGRFGDAEATLDPVVRSPQGRHAGLLVRAAMRLFQDRTADARDDLAQAGDDESPSSATAWQVAMPQIWRLIESGKPENALVLLDAMPARFANELEPTLARARALRRLDRLEAAEAALNAVLERHPDAIGGRVERAWVRLGRGNEAGSLEDVEAVNRFADRDGESRPAVLHLLAFAARHTGRLDEALGHVDALLELQPSAEFSLLRAEVLAELGRVDEARAAVREVLERSPRHQGALDLERRLTNG
ncbi:MAG: tetratricopeptide repeat protein, partial [Planctomycetes bacterium]|nr:tetratricopeptide repeat protein [Planctomycetota bacterium]